MTYDFGLPEAQSKELDQIMKDMGKLAPGGDWSDGTKREKFLALQARMNELVPPGSM